MTYLIKARYLMTMDSNYGILKDGALVIEKDKIVAVGPYDTIKKEYGSEDVIDKSKSIVIPGLISSHNHMYGILSHGMPILNAPSSFIGFLEDFWWPFVENVLDKEMIYWASKMAAIEMIKTGTTMHSDILEAPNAIPGALDEEAKATEEVGIRSILSFEATERISPENGELGIKENLEFVRSRNNKASLTRGMFCIHTTFTCSPEFLKRVRKIANEFDVGIQLHLEEGAYEGMYSLIHYRKLPVELYEEIGFLGPDVLASQCVHTKPHEIEILKKYDVKISHMPVSNCEVGGGIAPIPEFLKTGLKVGLGTDGYVVDMFDVMRFAFLIHKANKQDASVMPADVVFKMATIDNARVLRMEKEIGSLSPGKKADITILDPNLPTPINENNLYAQLVTFGTGALVSDVIIDGRFVMRDRKITTVNENEVRETFTEVAQAFWDGIIRKSKER